MAIHCTHDFLTIVSASCPTSNMYFATLFLTGVLGFTRVGHTNMNIVPNATGTVAINRGASINLGTGKEYYVQVPTASYTVPASSDNNKILVLKSRNYPLANSGLFRVLSGSVADNAFIIDYRTSSGTYPPIESGSLSGSLDWMLFASEAAFYNGQIETFWGFTDNNSATGYQGYGPTSTYPRIILQSPAGWQVRICAESKNDRWDNGITYRNGNTFSVGTGGNSIGDFSVRGDHTHGALFWDNTQDYNKLAGQTCGCDPSMGASNSWKNDAQWRVYMWGDDQTGSMMMFCRNAINTTDSMVLFGMAEQEPQPVPAKMAHRVFVIGASSSPATPNWTVGTANENNFVGQAFGLSNQPVSCVMSSYHLIYSDTAPRSLVTTDNPALKATELIPVELLAGTWTTQYVRNTPLGQNLTLEPRKLGLVPIVRQGRNNFGNWTTSTDAAKSWFHVANGMYCPWGGLAALP